VIATAVIGVGGVGLSAALAGAARRTDPNRRLRGLAASRQWRLPEPWRRRLDRALADAALDVRPEAACEGAVIAVVAVALVTFSVAPGLVPIAVPLTVGAGVVGLWAARGRAERRFVVALPGALEQVAAALRGGASVGEALETVAVAGGPLASDLAGIRARTALGITLADALAMWPTERPAASVRAVAGALAVASSVGGPAADALDGLAVSLRERLGAIEEARALAAQSRVSAFVVGGAPIAYLVFSAALDPTSIDTLVATGVGRVCLLLGLGAELLAALWMHRILSNGGLSDGGLSDGGRSPRRSTETGGARGWS
jgi:tight adherence protein B